LKKILGKNIYRKIRSLIKGQITNYTSSTVADEFRSPLGLYRQIALTNLFEKKIDLIFYTYFDFFTDELLEKFPEIDELLGIPWVALLFDPKKKQIEEISKSLNCQGIGAVDENSFNTLKRELNIRITLITDFVIEPANLEELKNSYPKKTISLIGTLSERKNLDLFLSAAFSRKGKSYNWLLHGKLHTANLKFITRLRIFKIKYYKHRNIMFKFSYLTDSEFNNALFNTNFMFLAYKNWTHASNLLTHSVLHRIPVIAFKNGEIGKLVDEYSLGAFSMGNKRKNVFQSYLFLPQYLRVCVIVEIWLSLLSSACQIWLELCLEILLDPCLVHNLQCLLGLENCCNYQKGHPQPCWLYRWLQPHGE
jgi:hypothetical protein